MSVLKRFRERQNRAVTVQVLYPKDAPEIELTVKRLPPALLSNADLDAKAEVKKRGFVEDEDGYEVAKNIAMLSQIALQMKPHVTGWRAVDGGQLPPFSQAQLTAFLDEMIYIERALLGMAYTDAVAELEKKSSPETTTEADS